MTADLQHLATAFPVTIRWREVCEGRGGRLARRVRECQTLGDVAYAIAAAGNLPVDDEFMVSSGVEGATTVVSRDELRGWTEGRRDRLRPIPQSQWRADEVRLAEWTNAIDGVRHALGRLAACGIVSEGWIEHLITQVHVAVQSLPTSSLPFWRP